MTVTDWINIAWCAVMGPTLIWLLYGIWRTPKHEFVVVEMSSATAVIDGKVVHLPGTRLTVPKTEAITFDGEKVFMTMRDGSKSFLGTIKAKTGFQEVQPWYRRIWRNR